MVLLQQKIGEIVILKKRLAHATLQGYDQFWRLKRFKATINFATAIVVFFMLVYKIFVILHQFVP